MLCRCRGGNKHLVHGIGASRTEASLPFFDITRRLFVIPSQADLHVSRSVTLLRRLSCSQAGWLHRPRQEGEKVS